MQQCSVNCLRHTAIHWGDLMMRVLDYIVTISFGYTLYCGYFNLYCGCYNLFCNVWLCVCVGFVMCGCVCVGGVCNVCVCGGFVMCGCV